MIVCERRSVKGSVLIEMETEGMVELSVILSIFHYFGGYFHMRNLAYFRRLFSRYSYRSPGRPSVTSIKNLGAPKFYEVEEFIQISKMENRHPCQNLE